MPKIPLYEDRSRIGVARGVEIDPSSTLKLASAGIEAEAQFVQDVLGLGQEVVSQIQESQQKANKANYEVEVNKLKNTLTAQRAERIDLNDIEYNNEVVKPELDKFYNNWAKTRKGLDYNYFNELWAEDKNTINTTYTNKAVTYKQEQFETDQIQLANEYYINNEIDKGDSVIDNIGTLSPEEVVKHKKSGQYGRMYNNINEAKTLDDVRIAYNDPFITRLDPNQAEFLRQKAIEAGSKLLKDQYKPTYDEGINLIKQNELATPWIESQKESNTLSPRMIKFFEGYVATSFRKTIADLTDSEKKQVEKIQTKINDFASTGEVPKGFLGIGKQPTRIEYLETLFEEAGDLELNINTIETMMRPLMSPFEDPTRNKFYLNNAYGNLPTINSTYEQTENLAMGAFRRNFNMITANMPSSLRTDAYLKGMQYINQQLQENSTYIGKPLTRKQFVDALGFDPDPSIDGKTVISLKQYFVEDIIIGRVLKDIYQEARQYEDIRNVQNSSNIFGTFELDIEEEFFPEK